MSKPKEKKNRKWIWIIPVACTLVLAAVIWINLLVKNEFTLTLSEPASAQVTVEYGTVYTPPTATARYEGSILHFWDADVEVFTTSTINPDKLGTYEVRMLAQHKDLVAESVIQVSLVDTMAPTILLVDSGEHFTSPKDSYEEEGFSALDNYDGDITDQVQAVEENGIVTYTVSDSSGNVCEVKRTIIYRDAEAPVITLKGEMTVSVDYGAEFKEPGYTAIDDCDGDLTKKVVVDGTVDTKTVGTYVISYSVKDSYDNETVVTRAVTVRDVSRPNVVLNGDSTIYVKVGSDYNELGATAWDNMDGDLSNSIGISNNVNINKKGIYSVYYSVSDSSGNSATVTRKVYVYEKQASNQEVNPGHKVVYLTFDDGPCQYTEKLLNVLDKYGVKATFFVTNQFPSYQYMIKEESKRGHTVAIHTFSHRYESVYANEEAYFADLNKMNEIILKQTGSYADILRFPGGSSNGISANYNKGIMGRLVKSVGVMGFQYADWNVSSGDGGGVTDRAKITQNVINGMKSHDVSVVLQHDLVKGSVDAVEEILAWGLANGYTFLPMDTTSPMMHHGVINN